MKNIGITYAINLTGILHNLAVYVKNGIAFCIPSDHFTP